MNRDAIPSMGSCAGAIWLAATLLPAQDTTPAPAVQPLTIRSETGRVFLDTEHSGAIWARGDDWKASFAATGFTFVPFLGSDAPRNFPLHLGLVAATVGDRELPLELAVAPSATAERVTVPRGVLTELYELAPTYVEQRFVVDRPVRGGALTVRMRVVSDLVPTPEADGGIRFVGPCGGVRYGRAIAFDAGGRRTDVRSRCADGFLDLTVPEDFLAAATFPLTIDPLVLHFGWQVGNAAVRFSLNADSACLGSFDGVNVAVFEEVYSQTDHDIYVRPQKRDGTQHPGGYVDFTSAYWANPQIASNRATSQFLVVAERGTPPGTTTIWGRTVAYASSGGVPVLSMGTQFAVHGFGDGKNPDVGGDPNPNATLPANWCVTWEGQINGEMYYNIVRTDGTLQSANGNWLDPGPEVVSKVRISKSCGFASPTAQEWILVWQKRYSPSDEDIYGSIIRRDGTVRALQFPIDTSSYSETNPEVSSPGDLIGGLMRHVVVYERTIPGSILVPTRKDILGQLRAGTQGISGQVDLTQLLGRNWMADQLEPAVDTDGSRFAVVFSELPPIATSDIEPYIATLHVDGTTLGVTSFPELCNAYSGPDVSMQITAERSGGLDSPRYVPTWYAYDQYTSSALGALYYGYSTPPQGGVFQTVTPGSGAITLSAAGDPAIGHTFRFELQNAQGLPFLLIGAPVTPTPVCPGSFLAIDQGTMSALFTTAHTISLPPWYGWIGLPIAAQGFDLFAPGACSTPVTFALSNAIVATVL